MSTVKAAKPRKFWRAVRTEPVAIASAIWLIIVAFAALVSPFWTPLDVDAIDLTLRYQPPFTPSESGFPYILGTDQLGRDYLSILMRGAGNSVGVALAASSVAVLFGLVVGSIAGYQGGKTDSAISRVIDAQLSFPPILFALLFLASVGASPLAVVFVLAAGAWPTVARISRSLALGIRQQTYVAAAKTLGGSTPHVLRRNVLPNLLGPVMIYGTVLFAVLMLGAAGLDFLGLGLQPPETSWGMVLAQSRDSIRRAWWLVTFPGLAIFLTTLAINLIAVAVRRHADSSTSRTVRGTGKSAAVVDVASTTLMRARSKALRPGRLTAVADSAPAAPPTNSIAVPESSLLSVRDLRVDFIGDTVAHAVRGVSFDLWPGEVVALVGESGSGKSVTARTIMGVGGTPPQVQTSGSVWFKGEDLLGMPPARRQQVYGAGISMVQQEAIAALNPSLTIGGHFVEAIRTHDRQVSKREALVRAVELLKSVGISDPQSRLKQHAHQLSGGMSQRVLIALAIANRPALLVADEPTTALDVTYQAQIMDLLMELRSDDTTILLITHDLGLVAERADRILVMYAGRIVESGTVAEVRERQAHPYTAALLNATPDLSRGRRPLLPIRGTPPNAAALPGGCAFNPRCEWAIDVCRTVDPPAIDVGDDHTSRCHRAEEVFAT